MSKRKRLQHQETQDEIIVDTSPDKKAASWSASDNIEPRQSTIIIAPDGAKIYPPETPASITGRADGRAQSCPLREPPTDRPIRVYADGVFDLFHIGHMNQLRQAKESFHNVNLIVGVCSDKETHKRKGKTVLVDTERYDSVRHCKWVDEVVEDAPWVIDEDFLKQHKIDYVAHDALPYVSTESGDVYQHIKEQGRFLETQRTEGVSTTDLIVRIVRDYDDYLLRNLSRGIKRKDLNVSFIKEQELHAKKGLADLRRLLMDNLHRTGDEILADLRGWEERSHEFARGFTTLFTGTPTNSPPHSQHGIEEDASDSDRVTSPGASSPVTSLSESTKNGRMNGFISKWFRRNRPLSTTSSVSEESPSPKRRRTRV